MAEYLVKGESLTALGDAIREQTGDTNLLTLEAMVVTIKNLNFSKTTPINVVPSTISTFIYDGTAKTPVWQNFDSEQLSIGGATSATNAGTHTVYFTPKAGYTWADESVESKEVSWVIEKKSVNVPSQSGTLTYNGNNQSPSWSNYNSNQMAIGGTTSGTNAGSYTATFTPNSNHKWSDGTTTAKSVTWSIAKAAGSLSLSATSATVTGKNSGAKTFTVTRAGDGKISVSSSNTAYATASVSGTTVTVTPKGYGTATITVSVAAGTNHKAPSSKTYTITINVLYLYNAGNECTSVTGGWTTAAKNIASYGYAAGTPYISKGSTSMTFGVKVASEGSICYAKNKINLAGYTTLKYEGTLQASDDIWLSHGLIVWNSLGTYYTDNIAASVELEGSGSTKSINVSNLNGSYYIGFGAYVSTFTIKKLWLE